MGKKHAVDLSGTIAFEKSRVTDPTADLSAMFQTIFSEHEKAGTWRDNLELNVSDTHIEISWLKNNNRKPQTDKALRRETYRVLGQFAADNKLALTSTTQGYTLINAPERAVASATYDGSLPTTKRQR